MPEIERAQESDIDSVWGIVEACSEQLVTFGHDHWSKYYSKDAIGKKVKDHEVYLKYIGNRPVGTMTLADTPVEYYEPKDMSSFAEPEADALYVSALAVLPEFQSKGIASELMTFAENRAKEMGLVYIRFDCRALYVDLVQFYRKRGYKVVGVLTDERDNYEPYFLMEKMLANDNQSI